MFPRSISLLLVFVIAVSPVICCGYGLERTQHPDSGAQRDSCCRDTRGVSRSESPQPKDRPCDEECQCVCAGAVLENPRNSERTCSWSPGPELVASGIEGPDVAATRASHPAPDPGGGNLGRSLRTWHQSFLC